MSTRTRSRVLRRAVALVATSGLVVALAACGGGSDEPTTQTSSGSAPSGTVIWWSWTPDTPVAQKYIVAFNKVHPEITVKYTNYENADYAPTMSSAFQTGGGPDMFNISPGGNVGGKQLWGDYAADLAPAGEAALGADWKTKFAPGYVDQVTYDGKVVALPLGGVASNNMWVDKSLFDKYGISTDLKTYADLKAACDKFAAAKVQCFTMGTNSTDTFATELLRTIANSFDPAYYLKALHGEASWDDPVMVKSLDMMRQMQADGIISQDATSIKQYPEANNNFMSQKAAIVQMGTWYAQYAAKASMTASMEGAGVKKPVPFTMMPITSPDFAGQGHVPQLVGEVDYGLAVNAKAKNPEAAKVFIQWMTTTPEGQQNVANAIDVVPALVGVQADWENLGLVSPDLQIPAFKKFFADAAASTETRSLYMAPETGNAQVTAVQEALASKSKSSAEIAKQVEVDSVDMPAE